MKEAAGLSVSRIFRGKSNRGVRDSSAKKREQCSKSDDVNSRLYFICLTKIAYLGIHKLSLRTVLLHNELSLKGVC